MAFEIKEVITKSTVYVTSDGKEFSDEDSATNHEEDLQQKHKEDACSSFRRTRQINDFGPLLNDFFQYSLSDGPVTVYTFHITNENELRLFCDAYKYWDSHLCKYGKLKALPYPQDYVLFDGIGQYSYYLAEKEEIQQAVDMLTAFTKICDE